MKRMHTPRWLKHDYSLLVALAAFGLWWRLFLCNGFLRNWYNLVRLIPDDAFYYFSIAKQLALGHGISIDGIHVTNGMHPLWLFLITPFFIAYPGEQFRDAVHGVLLFQSVLDASLILLIGDTIRRYLLDFDSANRRSAFFIPSLIFTLLAPWVNGLETTLTALLLIVWLRTAMRLTPTLGKRFWILLGLVTGILFLARTDMVVVVAPFALWVGYRHRFELAWGRILLSVLVALLVVAPWLVWNLIHFGTILQSSAEAVKLFAMRKYDVMYGPVGKYWHLTLEAARNAPKPFLTTTLGFSAITIGFSIYSTRRKRDSRHMILLLTMAGGLLLLVVHSLFRGFIREWYVQQLFPLFLIGFGVSIGINAGTSKVRISGRALLAVLLIVGLFFYHRSTAPNYRSQGGMAQVVSLWENIFASGDKVGAFNSGMYSFVTPRPDRLVNLDGVVNADVLPYLKNGTLGEYIRSDSIEYIIDFKGTIDGYLNLFDHHMLHDFSLDSMVGNELGDTMLLFHRKHTENRSQENAQK